MTISFSPLMKASLSLLLGVFFLSTSSAFAAPGDYKETSCAAPIFSANGCAASTSTQCFDGGTVAAGEKLTGLYDSWTNKNQTEQVIYQDEQKYPTLVNVGGTGTSWLSNPKDEKEFWSYGSEVIFTPETSSGTSRQVFSLKPGKTVRVMDAKLGANYQLEKTDKKAGEYVGLVKFPVNYRDVSDVDGKAGVLVNHLECVAFQADGQVAAAVAPVVKTPVTPPQVTQVKTGAADTFLFLGLAMLLTLAFMFARKRKSL